MVWVEHRDSVEHVRGVIGRSTTNVDARRRLRPNDHLATRERLQRVGLAEQRVIRGSGHRDATIGKWCAIRGIETADVHRRAYLDRAKTSRLGAKRYVDLEPSVG